MVSVRCGSAFEAIKETIAEIEYWHADMLTPEERAHPRGNGWARVYDKLQAVVAQAEGREVPPITQAPPERPAEIEEIIVVLAAMYPDFKGTESCLRLKELARRGA